MKTKTRKLTPAVAEVPSAQYLSLIWQHLTESLCEEVFAATRNRERQRKWTLYALVWFWIGLLQSRFGSQTRALLEARAGHPLFPLVDAAPEAFFQVSFRKAFSLVARVGWLRGNIRRRRFRPWDDRRRARFNARFGKGLPYSDQFVCFQSLAWRSDPLRGLSCRIAQE